MTKSTKLILIFFLLSLLPTGVFAQSTTTPILLRGPGDTAATSTPALLAMPQALTPASPAPEENFTFTYKDQSFKVSAQTLSSWEGQTKIFPNPAISDSPPSFTASLQKSLGQNVKQPQNFQVVNYNLGAIYDYLSTLSPKIDQPTVEPILKIDNGQVATFTPPQSGQLLDVYKSAWQTMQALDNGKNNLELSVNQTQPKNSLASTNNLGINQIIAHGVSTFSGSPNNRRHNIAVGVEKEKGVLVAPGATYSFNDNLGPVDGEHGFLPELVIKGSLGTIPEFGGGLCQVSSTAFRAAMDGGFPITERRNHAYAVQYYSPQGTDATIYPGIIDLKFTNDSPGYLLIWPYEKDKNTLVFDFYGTKDDRQVTLQKPVVYDRQTNGAMKATWTRVVLKAGETSTSTFKSVYQPPALFHHDTQFVSTTGQPTSSGLKIPPVKTE